MHLSDCGYDYYGFWDLGEEVLQSRITVFKKNDTKNLLRLKTYDHLYHKIQVKGDVSVQLNQMQFCWTWSRFRCFFRTWHEFSFDFKLI